MMLGGVALLDGDCAERAHIETTTRETARHDTFVRFEWSRRPRTAPSEWAYGLLCVWSKLRGVRSTNWAT